LGAEEIVHRCHVEPGKWTAAGVRLSADEIHYLRDVLRVRHGEPVALFDGRGREAVADVALDEASGSLALSVREERPSRRPAVAITLVQALPKGARMDWIVEKATELGASVIVPALTERVVARLAEGPRRAKAARWQRIALNAARQCETGVVPTVREVTDFPAALKAAGEADLFLVGSLQPEAKPLRDVMRGIGGSRPATVALLIGPEGDLTPAELQAAAAAGAQAASFGARVLRVETAALYGLSVLAYELGS